MDNACRMCNRTYAPNTGAGMCAFCESAYRAGFQHGTRAMAEAITVLASEGIDSAAL